MEILLAFLAPILFVITMAAILSLWNVSMDVIDWIKTPTVIRENEQENYK